MTRSTRRSQASPLKKPPNQRVRRPIFLRSLWRLCPVSMPKQHQAILGGTKTRIRKTAPPFPLDGFGSSVPSLQLHPVSGAASSRVPPGDAMSRFVGFGDKSWDNSKKGVRTNSWTIRSG